MGEEGVTILFEFLKINEGVGLEEAGERVDLHLVKDMALEVVKELRGDRDLERLGDGVAHGLADVHLELGIRCHVGFKNPLSLGRPRTVIQGVEGLHVQPEQQVLHIVLLLAVVLERPHKELVLEELGELGAEHLKRGSPGVVTHVWIWILIYNRSDLTEEKEALLGSWVQLRKRERNGKEGNEKSQSQRKVQNEKKEEKELKKGSEQEEQQEEERNKEEKKKRKGRRRKR